MHQIAILHDHPYRFQPLFSALERAGIDYLSINTAGHVFDPISGRAPAPVIFNRVAMSATFAGQPHPAHYAMALLDHWAGQGALVLNGADAMAIDSSRARQLALINRLGLASPATRVVHDSDAMMIAAVAIGFPLVIRADIGEFSTDQHRFDNRDELETAIAYGDVPVSANGLWLVQAVVRPRGGTITHIEVLGGRCLYALDVQIGVDQLMSADAARRQPLATRRSRRAEPPPNLIAAAEMLAREAGMESCGIQYLIDDQCGTPRFCDIKGLSVFVDDPMDMLGWDPDDRLVERLWHHIRRMGG
ncbi:MAG: alpha-L-glutamate ligase [Sphingomonadales bacterium]|jgi:glutathione synthase/RimK-type ligase-like ATP-grasp enzyme